MKDLEWPEGTPMGVRVGKTPSGEWKFEYQVPLQPKYGLKKELLKFQDLPEIDDPAAEQLIASLLPGLDYGPKFLTAAVGYVAAFLEHEAESLEDLPESNLPGLFAALVAIVVNDTLLFVQALEWEQNGRPDISTSDGHPALRDACIIIFEAAG